MPKKISPEVKARAVRMVTGHQQEYASVTAAAAAVAKQLGLGRETVRGWVVDAEVDAGTRAGTTSAEQAEIKALKAKVRRLEEDNAILKVATTFFVGELDSRNRRSWPSSTPSAPRAMRSSRSVGSCPSRAARSPHERTWRGAKRDRAPPAPTPTRS